MKRLALMIALLAASAAPAHAAPGDYGISYDWTGANDGFVGWDQFEVPAAGQPGTPFYAARLALPKLRIAPSPAADGTTDRTYPAVEGPLFGPRRATVVQAPGTTRIRSATFDDVDYLRTSNERQFLRLAVYGDPSAVDADNVYDFRPDAPPNGGAPGSYQNDVTYAGVGPATVDPAEPGLSAQLWMLTSCDPSCPFVQFGPGGAARSYGQVGRVQLDLFDPEAPEVSASGPLTSGGWTNAREPRSATVASSDPGAGMRAISATRRRQGGGTVTVLSQGSDCDRTHTRLVGGPGREAAPCPDQLNAAFTQSLGALSDGEYTYTVTATDDSDRTSAGTFVVGLDRTRPGSVSGSGPLRSLIGRWTNRTDKPSLLVRGRDTRAGIRSLEIVADVGGTDRIVATADLGCTTSCPASYTANLFSDLNALPDGRVPISVRATDAAGNVSERPVGTLMLDRVAPPAPVVAARTAGASTVLAITPAADPPPGSGVVGFVASYRTAANAALRSLRVAAADRELRARGTRARIAARVEGDVEVRSVDRAGNTGAAFAAGAGTISCREALENPAFVRPAKIGEVRAGRDTTGTLSYGEQSEKTLELVGGLGVKGVGVGFSESYTRSAGFEMAKIAEAGTGYNVSVNLILRPERLRRYVNGKRRGYCKRTVGPKKVYQVVNTAAVALAAPAMAEWQRKRADCNNDARWRGHRLSYPPGYRFTKNQNNQVKYSAGLSLAGVGFTTANTWGQSSSVGYVWKSAYKQYWICGDGGRRDGLGKPDPKTWINLFAGADTSSGRTP